MKRLSINTHVIEVTGGGQRYVLGRDGITGDPEVLYPHEMIWLAAILNLATTEEFS